VASDQPYNELGQILAEGAEIALGLAIIRDISHEGFLLLMGRRVEPIRDIDRDELMLFVNRMIESGIAISDLPPGSELLAGMIPVNEFLYGGRAEGRRVKFVGEVQFEEGGQWVEVRVNFPDIPTIDELREELANKGRRIGESCRDKFGLPKDESVTVRQVRVLLPERLF